MDEMLITGIGNEVLISTVALGSLFVLVSLYVMLVRRRNAARPSLQMIGYEPLVERRRSNNGVGDEIQNTCPICLSELVFCVKTNCSHLFCGQCIRSMYSYHYYGRFRCPICRQTISVIYKYFTANEMNSANNSLVTIRDSLSNFVNNYNLRMSTDYPVVYYFLEMQGLVRFLHVEFINQAARFESAIQSLLFVIWFLSTFIFSAPTTYDMSVLLSGQFAYVDYIVFCLAVFVHLVQLYRGDLVRLINTYL